MLEFIAKNIKTHKLSSLLVIIISCLLVLFLLLYLGGIQNSQQELDNLPKALPVEGEIVNPDGSWDRDLQISASIVQKLERTEMIEKVQKTANFYIDDTLTVYSDDEQASLGFDTLLSSVNTLDALPYIDIDSIVFFKDHKKDFVTTDEAVCILESDYMGEQGLNIGDTYKASIYRKKYESSAIFYEFRYVTDIEMKIIGRFEIDITKIGNTEAPIAIAPMKYVRKIFKEADTPYYVHSMRFALNDAKRLDEFKEAASGIGLIPRNPLSGLDNVGSALVLFDESFIKTEKNLTNSVSLRRILLPLIFLAVGGISFLISYILMQSRRTDFAIMRSLGTGMPSIFFTTLAESFLLSFMGGFIGCIIGIMALEIVFLDLSVIFSLFLLLYMLGTLVALLFLSRFSVMEILTKTD